MSIIIPRLTFRLHDNLLLAGSRKSRVIIILQQETITNWSCHQLNLMLQVIASHIEELPLRAEFHILKITELDALLESHKNNIITDYVNDPLFNDFNRLLKKHGAKFINTFTMINWRQQPHQKFLTEFHQKRKSPYSKLTNLKTYIVSQSIKPTKTVVSKKVNKTNSLLTKTIDRLQTEMVNSGLTLHKFVLGDAKILAHAKKVAKLVDYKGWSKPKTNASAIWGQHSKRTTTQLSPYFSLGTLSVRWFWHHLKYSGSELGTIRDQLLWRESFHSFAVAAEIKLTPTVVDFWSDKHNSKFVQNYKWIINNQVLKKWQTGTITDFPANDLNRAMQQLQKTGWIHHLARHLVADVLTRGKLCLNWQEGERWFRKTLLDHDAVLNRANWMWLSAVAFSSKQKAGYHYNPDNYISRH